MSSDLGKLKRTLKEKCSNCNHPLQLRVRSLKSLLRGVEILKEEEYKYCSNCKTEIEIRNKDLKKRTEHFDKTR